MKLCVQVKMPCEMVTFTDSKHTLPVSYTSIIQWNPYLIYLLNLVSWKTRIEDQVTHTHKKKITEFKTL